MGWQLKQTKTKWWWSAPGKSKSKRLEEWRISHYQLGGRRGLVAIQSIHITTNTKDTYSRVEVPLTSSSTSEEKWRTGRWSPGGLEEKRKRIFPFLKQEVDISVIGACSWWGAFTQCGDIPLMMAFHQKFWPCLQK